MPVPTGYSSDSSPLRIAVTFDIDMVDANWPRNVDECSYFFSDVLPILRSNSVNAGTLFVRIDDEMERTYGRSDHLLEIYCASFDALRASGWEIGWHLHSYTRIDGVARQNIDEAQFLKELRRHGPRARAAGMNTVRIGWGFMTCAIMCCLTELGFAVDSSAIPRPRYPWEQSVKDWEGAPQCPYLPSARNYRRPGPDALNIVEVPMPVLPIPAPGDTQVVLRYINLAFHPTELQSALAVSTPEPLVTITHPHDLLHTMPPRGLLSQNLDALSSNLAFLKAGLCPGRARQWVTISQLANLFHK